MIIEIVNTTIGVERELGPVYRIEQLRDGVPWVHLITQAAVATDMELFGVDDPAVVIGWHLREALAPLDAEPSAADRLAFDAQALTADATLTRARGGNARTSQSAAEATQQKARDLKASEIGRLQDVVTVADDDGLAALHALVTDDRPALDTVRLAARDRITNHITL